jgi:hypothetical protein
MFFSKFALAEIQILKASTIITMDDKNPRAEAIAFDAVTKKLQRSDHLKSLRTLHPMQRLMILGQKY